MNKYGKDFSKLSKFKDDRKKKKPNFRGTRGKFKRKELYNSQKKSWELIDEEISNLTSRYDNIESSAVQQFSDFPLSTKTIEGLKLCKYEAPTEIQKETIGLALQGKDILGAAKTGSGKTLAFLVPILELLFRQKWTHFDGLGALIISPTRELAYQTFEVLRKIGKKHDFSAGLVIGGKHLKEESERINHTNIVVCTPGRLLQHMDETVNFSAHTLHILVLDEADRILDLGFAQTMNAVIENLPSERQTLLFSATQTKSVKELARLSLHQPMYVSVHEHCEYSTPSQLNQSYIVCELHEKLNLLWSFIKNHLKSKVLVFFQSCKQVKYTYEVFKKLRTGLTTLSLHGGMHQLKRVAMYEQFSRKKHAVLFATDIAARGLDFPAVNWVIQLDCPEDANTYIHRAGRTARYEKDGEALLILLPSEEEEMVNQLQQKKIPIKNIEANPKKMWSIQGKMESLCASDVTLKESAQRAFVSYLRSIFLMSNKKVFDVHTLDMAAFSRSLGLAIPPRVRFIQRDQKRREQQKQSSSQKSKDKIKRDSESEDDFLISKLKSSRQDSLSESSEESDENDKDLSIPAVSIAEKRLGTLTGSETSSGVGSSHRKNLNRTSNEIEEKSSSGSPGKSKASDVTHRSEMNFQVSDDEQDDFLKVKGRLLPDSDEEDEELTVTESKKKKPLTKAAIAKKIMKKKLQVNTKVAFDEEGYPLEDVLKSGSQVGRTARQRELEEEVVNEGGINIEAARKRMLLEDQIDKQLYRQRIRNMHREKRLKLKEERRREKEEERGGQAILGGQNQDSDEEGQDGGETIPADHDGNESDASFDSTSYDNYNAGETDDMAMESEDGSGDDDNSDDNHGDNNSDDNGDSSPERLGDNSSDSNEEIQQSHSSQLKRRRLDQTRGRKVQKVGHSNNSHLTLADQEDLALRLLQTS